MELLELRNHSNKSRKNDRWVTLCLAFVFSFSAISFPGIAFPAPALSAVPGIHAKTRMFPLPYSLSSTEISSNLLSAEAQQLAQQLNIETKLRRLEQLQLAATAASSAGGGAAIEQRLEVLELKQELTEILEQTRMEIDYARSALFLEEAIQTELVRAYSSERDTHVLESNLWSFRTNGVLWTLAEALSIPTYSHPRYSISSGTLGILAGLVPTAFSIVAARESQGGKFERPGFPNMLAKIFDYKVGPMVDYPPSVWQFIHSPALDSSGKSRIDLLIEQWLEDKNIKIFTSRTNKSQLDRLTGNATQCLTVDLLADRVAMLTQLDALIALMNRPVLELMLAVRGGKHYPEAG